MRFHTCAGNQKAGSLYLKKDCTYAKPPLEVVLLKKKLEAFLLTYRIMAFTMIRKVLGGNGDVVRSLDYNIFVPPLVEHLGRRTCDSVVQEGRENMPGVV